MAHGHSEAHKYPLGMLNDEVCLVTERVNGLIVTEANLLQSAVLGILIKKSRESFDGQIRKLSVEARLIDREKPEEEG